MKKWIFLGVCVVAALGGYALFAQRDAIVATVARTAIDYIPAPKGQEADAAALSLLAKAFLAQDDVTRRIVVLLQNNMELRPGGGFLGQYAIVTIRNGRIVEHRFEDANILDQRITSDEAPPAPLALYGEIKKWKFRDSNWSPHFEDNAQKAQDFLLKSGMTEKADAVVAVNATILNDLLQITGPITLTDKKYADVAPFTADNALHHLQDEVEKVFIRDEQIRKAEKEAKAAGVPYERPRDENGKKIKKVTDAERQNRKNIIGALMATMVERLTDLSDAPRTIPALHRLALTSLRQKDIQVWFRDASLQTIAQQQYWDGAVDAAWDGDYLMIVDANLGALKSDHYITRRIEHTVDFRGMGAEKNTGPSAAKVAASPGQRMVRYRTPALQDAIMEGTYRASGALATTRVTYAHTATASDWRTSDYHSYTRMLVPHGATQWIAREWFPVPTIDTAFNKTVYGYKFDLIIGDVMPLMLQYILPTTITEESYRFKIQKQSGVGAVPLTLRVITTDGTVYTYEKTIEHDEEIHLSNMTKK